MSGIKREFNLVTEYVETLASKDYPLIVHKFFNEMMTLMKLTEKKQFSALLISLIRS